MQAFIIKCFLYFFSMLPLRANHTLGHFFGLLLYYSKSRSYKVSTINIGVCFPHLNEQQQKKIVKDSLIELGKSITELGPIWLWSRDKTMALLTQVSGKHHIDEAKKAGKGIILITPHMGCWELAGLYLGCELPVTILYRPPKLQALDALMRKARQKTGASLATTDLSGIKIILKALKKGHSTGLLPDQNPEDFNSGVYAPFFGIPVNTITLISRLASKTNASVVIGYAERLTNGKGFHLRIHRAVEEISSSDPLVSATALNKTIETYIHENPAQYQWSYKRFKKLPKKYKRLY